MKRFIIKPVFYIVIFLGAIRSYAQEPCQDLALPQEQVILHLDRNVCLTGETLWFKAWCFLDGQLEREMSKVLYVEIFDETRKAIVQEKYLLNNNQATGSIQIPESAPSKYYFLKAYTQYMRNFPSNRFHYQQVTIVNPFIENASITADPATYSESYASPLLHDSPPAEHLLRITLSQEKHQPRQPIRISISSEQPLTAELSATVRLKGLGHRPAPEMLRQNQWLRVACEEDPFCRPSILPDDVPNSPGPENALTLKPDHLEWLPETRGLTVSGFIQNGQSEKVAGAPTIVAVLQEAPMLHRGLTDEEGAFTIRLQNMEDQQNLFIGTPNENHKVLIRNDFDTDLPEITTVPLQFDSTLHRFFEALNLHQQLDRVYPGHTTQAITTHDPLQVPSTNILAPDRRVTLSDFIKVSTMSEVFKEIATGVALRKREGKEGLSVFNPEQQKWYDSPLVLLDNVPVFNIEELLKIDPAKVEAVEMYDSDYILGDYTIGGIISILTKTDDFAGYQWGEQVAFTTFKAFAAPRAFEQVLHPAKSHYPDFRPVLYWQPRLKLEPEQNGEDITVSGPDRPGVYEIVVQGFTQAGVPCLGYATFEVVQGE